MNAIAPLSRRGFLASIAAAGAVMTFAVKPDDAAAAAGDFEPPLGVAHGAHLLGQVTVLLALDVVDGA